MKQMYVYIMTNRYNTVFYIGVTNNILRRVYEHKNKLVKGFTEKYNVEKLVYFEVFEDTLSALSREKSLKNLLRRKKIDLIKKDNPFFRDLYQEILSG